MKLNKSQLRAVITLIVIFVVYNVLSLVLPFKHTGVFWLGYAFGIIAIVASVLILILAFGKDQSAKSRFYGFPIARIGVIYLIVQIVLSFLAMALAGIAGIPAWPFVLVFILALAAAILGAVATDTTRDEIENLDTKLAKDVSAIRELRSLGGSLVTQCDDEVCKAELKKLSDTLTYCDPVSNEATEGTEAELKSIMQEIQQAIIDADKENIINLCRKATAVLAERNRLCKLNK